MASTNHFGSQTGLTVSVAGGLSTGAVTEAYGVWVEKNMYGQKILGIERADPRPYLMMQNGNIARICAR